MLLLPTSGLVKVKSSKTFYKRLLELNTGKCSLSSLHGTFSQSQLMELMSQQDFSFQEWSLGVDLVICSSEYKLISTTMVQTKILSTVILIKLCEESLLLLVVALLWQDTQEWRMRWVLFWWRLVKIWVFLYLFYWQLSFLTRLDFNSQGHCTIELAEPNKCQSLVTKFRLHVVNYCLEISCNPTQLPF